MILPPQLQKYQSIIESSKLEVIDVILNYSEDLGFLDSKLGGEPYWPSNLEYPRDADGLPKLLLAQINCTEIPKSSLLPNTGILQFFVTGIDILTNEHVKVVYHSNIDETNIIEDFEELYIDVDTDDTPLRSSFGLVKLDFEKAVQYIAPLDYRFESFFEEPFNEKFDETTKKLYFEALPGIGHRMGGYIYTTQIDPRIGRMKDNPNEEEMILLLQLDSEDDYIGWGDAGLGHFFIKPSDLKKLDFSNVFFSWDCS